MTIVTIEIDDAEAASLQRHIREGERGRMLVAVDRLVAVDGEPFQGGTRHYRIEPRSGRPVVKVFPTLAEARVRARAGDVITTHCAPAGTWFRDLGAEWDEIDREVVR